MNRLMISAAAIGILVTGCSTSTAMRTDSDTPTVPESQTPLGSDACPRGDCAGTNVVDPEAVDAEPLRVKVS